MVSLASFCLLLTFLWFWKIALSNKCTYQTRLNMSPQLAKLRKKLKYKNFSV